MSARQHRNAAHKKRKDNQGRAKDLAPSSSSSSSFPPTVVTDAALKSTKRTRSTSHPLPDGQRRPTERKKSTNGKIEGKGKGEDAPLDDSGRTLHPIQSLDESDPPAYEEGREEGDILPMKVSIEVSRRDIVCVCVCMCTYLCLCP